MCCLRSKCLLSFCSRCSISIPPSVAPEAGEPCPVNLVIERGELRRHIRKLQNGVPRLGAQLPVLQCNVKPVFLLKLLYRDPPQIFFCSAQCRRRRKLAVFMLAVEFGHQHRRSKIIRRPQAGNYIFHSRRGKTAHHSAKTLCQKRIEVTISRCCGLPSPARLRLHSTRYRIKRSASSSSPRFKRYDEIFKSSSGVSSLFSS